MKGLIVSIIVFVLYVLSTTAISHVKQVKRHSRLFFPAVLAWTPIYFLIYFATPRDFFFLGPEWMVDQLWLDIAYGYVVFLLNCHSYIDFFFGFNGGFSMSLMYEILKRGNSGMSTEEVLGLYVGDDGVDKIFGWRLPRLVETGWITLDNATGVYGLSPKGRAIAKFTYALKRLMNLGEGG